MKSNKLKLPPPGTLWNDGFYQSSRSSGGLIIGKGGTVRSSILIVMMMIFLIFIVAADCSTGSLTMSSSSKSSSSDNMNSRSNYFTSSSTPPIRTFDPVMNDYVVDLRTTNFMEAATNNSNDDKPNDANVNNGTIVIDMSQGGVTFTIITNLSIGLIFLILFVLFRPFLPLFNLKEKKKLLKNVKENIRSRNNYINYKDKGGDIYPTVDEDFLENTSIINRVRQDSKFINLLDLKEDDDESGDDEDDVEQEVDDSNVTITPSGSEYSTEYYNNNNNESSSSYQNYHNTNPNVAAANTSTNRSVLFESNRSPTRKLSMVIPYQQYQQTYQQTITKLGSFKQKVVAFCREKYEFLVEFTNFAVDVLLSFVSKTHNHEDMERLLNRYSRDVAVYLLFQKEFISAMFLIAVLCSVVLLPLHLTQSTDINDMKFDFNGYTVAPSDYPLLRTTISMVLDSPFLLLIHVFLSFAVSFIFGLFLFKFARHDIVSKENYGQAKTTTEKEESILISSRSVLVQNIPSDFNSEPQFEKMVKEELCPGLRVHKAVLIYDVYDRIQMQNDYQDTCDQLEHYEFLQEIHAVEKRTIWRHVYRDHSSKLVQLKERKRELRLDMQHWDKIYASVKKDEYGAEHDIIPCLRYGFIVFETAKDAEKCLDMYYKRGDIKMPIKVSTLSDIQNEGDVLSVSTVRNIIFQIKQAYEPDDINWENMLTYTGFFDSFRNILMQFLVILIFVFLTTPMALFSSLESLTRIPIVHISLFRIKESAGEFGSIVFQYAPTLALHLFSIFLPYGIWYAQDFSKFRSKSRYMRKIIARLFMYLVLSTLIMPMLSLTSFDAFINLIQQQGNISQMLSNMFLPGAGSYFFNFVLQTAILKNCEDILRIYNLIYYLWGTKSLPKTSSLEKLKACELSLFYFEYEYPYMLTIIAICITNSLFSPLILLCCLLYLVFKHLVDRYVIMYIYGHVSEGACKGVLTSNFQSHRKLVALICSLVMSIMAIYHGSMTLFFGIRIKANAWFIMHTVFSGLSFLGIISVWFMYFTKNTTAKDFIRQRIFKPIKNLFIIIVGNRTFFSKEEETEEYQELGKSNHDSSSTYYGATASQTNLTNNLISFKSTENSQEILQRMNRAYEPPFKYFVNEIEADQNQTTQSVSPQNI